MNDMILYCKSEYSHSKLEALKQLIADVDHVHVFGLECKRWEQMIECSIHIMAISYPEILNFDFMDDQKVVCI